VESSGCVAVFHMNTFDPSTLIRDYGNWRFEATACRNDCALFDFSFMSRAQVSGPDAETALASFQNRSVCDMQPGQIRYALRVDSAQSVIADLTIWRNENNFEVMSGRHRDIADLVAMQNRDLQCIDLTADTAIFAVQGPMTYAALQSLTNGRKLAALDYFSFEPFVVAGIPCMIGRLGYTGELGVEIIAPRIEYDRLWSVLAQRIKPAGFAAIDSLRIEAGFMLFANDLALEPTVSELGVDPTNTEANVRDRFRFICCTAKTNQDPVLWQRPASATAPDYDEICVTSACISTVAQSVLVLGFCRPNANPDRPLLDRTGLFTDIRPVSRPFFDPDKARPRGRFNLS